jgi:anti-sigma B factor antagonist
MQDPRHRRALAHGGMREPDAAPELLLTRDEPSRQAGGAAVTPPVGLTVRDVGENGRHTLVLCGELDIASAPMLEAAVAEVPDSGTRALVLDLSEVTFMDSSGLKALLATYRRCQEHEREFSVAGASDRVRRVLDMTGVSRAIGLE